MSPRKRRAAVAALAGALAVGGPIAAAHAATPRAVATQDDQGPADPGNGTAPAPSVPPTDAPADPVATGGSGSTPPDAPIPTAPVPGNAQCGQVILTATLPTVVTCGPITVTFNTVTTTTTITTITAPITAANGSITTTTNAPSTTITAPVSSRSCAVNTTTRPRRRTTVKRGKPAAKHKPVMLVSKLRKGAHAVRFCLYFAPRPGA